MSARDGLDAEALAAWTSAATGGLIKAGEPLDVVRLAGGSSNLTYRVRSGDGAQGARVDWVLRRPPLRGALPTAHDMTREYTVQAALAGTGVPVPRMVALCEDPAVLGTPFYLMEFVPGVQYAGAERVAALAPAVAHEAALALARTLAELHAVDPRAAGLGAMVRDEPYALRQLRRWRGQWERSRIDDVPGLAELMGTLLDRLDATVPTAGPARIVHGDYNLANVLYAPDDPARVSVVLDWEMATVGDAAADVGQLLAYWGPAGRLLGAGRGGHPPDANPGMPGRDALLDAYLERGGVGGRELAFWEVFAVVKLAVVCAGARARLTGAGDAERAARAERIAETVEQLARIAIQLG